MRIIPNETIVMCDLVRKVRNIFAHNFEIDVIDDIDSKLIKNINQLYREKTKSTIEKELIEKFHSLYSRGYSELRTYEKNVKLLRETVDDVDFEKNIKKINEDRRHIFHENLRKEKPIKTIDRGNGEVEDVFPQGLSVIRKKIKTSYNIGFRNGKLNTKI